MELSMRPTQAFLPAMSDASSPTMLIECGLQCARQGNWSDAGYFFQLAHERLLLMEQQFVPELDQCIQVYMSYVQAQQDLHRASKQFAQAESTLQTQLLLLEKVLPTLRDSKERGQEQTATLTVTPLSNNYSAGTTVCPSSTHTVKDGPDLPALHITCFGHFEVRRSDQPMKQTQPTKQAHRLQLCQNRSGQAILRFLVVQPGYRASADKLIDILW